MTTDIVTAIITISIMLLTNWIWFEIGKMKGWQEGLREGAELMNNLWKKKLNEVFKHVASSPNKNAN